MTENVKYVVMAVHRWDGCELDVFPPGTFGGMNNDSIGFMPVFDDIEKLKAAYLGYAITKIKEEDEHGDEQA